MEDSRSLQDLVKSHARSEEREEKKPEAAQQEDITCGICFEPTGPARMPIHTQCTPELHIFHKDCLATWYARTDQQNHKKCPTCRTNFKSSVKKILKEQRDKMREAQEAENPALRVERENRRFWAKFTHFTALGLGLISVVGIPFVIKEYAYGPGPRGPIFAQAADIIVPTTITLALPLEQHALRLEREEE